MHPQVGRNSRIRESGSRMKESRRCGRSTRRAIARPRVTVPTQPSNATIRGKRLGALRNGSTRDRDAEGEARETQTCVSQDE